ncbi:gamma-glutamyltransferase [Oceanicella actignis]|uniref:Gamma-glutamyltranspeptidase / glutathione hydrolase n=1 Tax=Oceanicella actignis TaxID=1189325 RepID=A0A1M7TEC6_9RHOB|nr:gamma-glutamyltransferase [Oceanicella actignis]SET62424.1 gamma-glutamyltranspeptidase / glutathione hydrolase [Oceanicella actignis]SHN69080.1 gamma-glutamyltranspeptidase / glutathione hydrolase [Oceanicella actignis]
MTAAFAVAAGHQLTAEAAAAVLREGGSAVDACIAGALTACVAEPVLASLLGGGFLTVRPPRGKAQVLDFFVHTPRRRPPARELDLREIQADFGDATQAFHIGAGTIAAPGVARGLAEAHARFGRVPMRELAAPAVAAAREGVALTDFQAEVLRIVAPIFGASAPARALYFRGDAPAPAGETLRNPELADVLEVFAIEGPRFVHEGEVAAALLSLCAEGGALTAEDLRRYAPIWREPLSVRRAGARIDLNPPPALGGALSAFALELLGPGARAIDLARAFALSARARLESGIDQDAAAGAARLLSGESLALWRARLAGARAATRGTTHVSAVDRDGFAAALTLSNGEGCGLIAPGCGIMPNNMLGEEDLCPDGPDAWPEDARLASMMAPAVVSWPDGAVMAIGSGGSNRIRTAMAQTLSLILDEGAPPDVALAAPRLHVEGARDPQVDFEDRFPEDQRAELLAAFPEARPWPRDSMFFGGVHAALRDARGGVAAAGDHRRDGAARLG